MDLGSKRPSSLVVTHPSTHWGRRALNFSERAKVKVKVMLTFNTPYIKPVRLNQRRGKFTAKTGTNLQTPKG